MNKLLFVAILVVAVGSGAGCATKKFVRTEVGGLNDGVQALTRSVEENQTQLRDNTAKIAAHEKRIDAVDEKADTAQGAATAARSVADRNAARVETVERSVNRIVPELVLTVDQAGFAFGNAALSDALRAQLDAFAQQLKTNQRGVFLEIEGHTDATGPEAYNEVLGLERAQAVEQYLHETHQIPLHRMNVVSYGERKPVAPNATRDGRAHNRRVVVRVLG